MIKVTVAMPLCELHVRLLDTSDFTYVPSSEWTCIADHWAACGVGGCSQPVHQLYTHQIFVETTREVVEREMMEKQSGA